MIAAFDPPQVRKAAAFAEAIRRVEEEFGYRLESAADGLLIAGDAAPVGSPFVLVRAPNDGLALGVRLDFYEKSDPEMKNAARSKLRNAGLIP